ncbi:MAG: hypothetical protein HYR62_07835 [Actinobacteria bacterium]|nr:hypothetical protein [Actinomycetota bacterium]MBI3687596.1 hypothetical protein [Actinomycetota bacterium]
MTRHDPVDPAAPLDGVDIALLDEIRDMYAALDPVPEHLIERVLFAIALEDLDIEVLRPAGRTELLALTRGTDEARTITFDGASLTVMVSITATGQDTVRLDGWLAPPDEHAVELRTERGLIRTRADRDGRFAIPGAPRGLAQLVVHPVGAVARARAVVTPSVVL